MFFAPSTTVQLAVYCFLQFQTGSWEIPEAAPHREKAELRLREILIKHFDIYSKCSNDYFNQIYAAERNKAFKFGGIEKELFTAWISRILKDVVVPPAPPNIPAATINNGHKSHFKKKKKNQGA